MPGLVPGIHVYRAASKTWMAGTRPAMTSYFGQRNRKTLSPLPIVTVLALAIRDDRLGTSIQRNTCLHAGAPNQSAWEGYNEFMVHLPLGSSSIFPGSATPDSPPVLPLCSP